MKIVILLTLLTLSWSYSYPCAAKVHEKLGVEQCAKLATHIVVATEGNIIDGQLTVLESLKGNLQPGVELSLPDLAAFNSEESRAIDWLFPSNLKPEGAPREYVTGSRMILFLQVASQPTEDEWTGVGNRRSIYQSTIWVEERRTFAFYDVSSFNGVLKNERGILADFECSEDEIRVKIELALEN